MPNLMFFLLMRSINDFYGSAELRIKTPDGLTLTIVRSAHVCNLWKPLLAGEKGISRDHSTAAWLSTLHFYPAGAFFDSQRAIARCKLSTHDLNFTVQRSAARSGGSLGCCDGK